jgi:hypothetical protein
MSIQKFKSKLEKAGSWTIVRVPFDARKIWGSGGYTRIMGSIDGMPFKGTLMPMGDGIHCFPVKAGMRKEIRKDAGDPVSVILEKDLEVPVIEMPSELKGAFKASKEAKKLFDSYTPSVRKEYCKYISEGKKKETREKRAVDVVLKLEKLYAEGNFSPRRMERKEK